MGGDPNHLEEAVRESLANLSDRELILRTQSGEYTEFARQAAREEMAKRNRVRATGSHSVLDSSNEESDREDSRRDTAGCYVDLWRGKGYEGEHLRVDGPAEYSNMRSQPAEWGNDVCSLRVGPCAFVEAYEDEGLTGNMVCFGPNQEVPDLAEIEFDDKLGSIKIINSIEIFDRLGSARKVDTGAHEDLAKQKPKRQKGGKRRHNRKAQRSLAFRAGS